MSDIWPKGRLAELAEDECWSVLASHGVGRLVWVHDGRPHVVPVNFVARDGAVFVRTTPYSRLALEAPRTVVAFEVDEIDDYTRSGVSVVVEGACEHVEGPAADEVESWADGTRTMVLRVDGEQVSGRRLLPN